MNLYETTSRSFGVLDKLNYPYSFASPLSRQAIAIKDHKNETGPFVLILMCTATQQQRVPAARTRASQGLNELDSVIDETSTI